MFYLTKERQMLFDAANRYIFDEELSEEFKQDCYNEFDEYVDYLPAHFYAAIQQKRLFHDEVQLAAFQQWCDEVKETFWANSHQQYKLRDGIAQQLDASARELMQHSFHDGEIIFAEQVGDDFVLCLDMRGGFLPHAYVKLTFTKAHVTGDVEGYYIYDELQQDGERFGLRVLSSWGSPYHEATIYFSDLHIEGVYYPAVYKERGDVTNWASFKARLTSGFHYYLVDAPHFIPVALDAISEQADGFYVTGERVATDYEAFIQRLVCDQYEDPYAYLSEPVETDALYDAVFGDDDVLRVRALNTLFARGEEVAPIVTRILSDMACTEENEVYLFALANHFYKQQWLDETLYLKWK